MKPNLYGKYAGKLEREKNYLQNCSEMELFIQVNTLYEPINSYNNITNMISFLEKQKRFFTRTNELELVEYISNKEKTLTKELEYLSTIVEKINDEEWAYSMDYCILQTARFGTNVSYNPNGRIIITEEFKNWYNNWQAFITYANDETLSYYRTCRYEGKGLDKFNFEHSITKKQIIKELDSTKPHSHQLTKKSTGLKFA